MKIAFVVSGNGYGHLRRVCTVVDEIFKADQKTEVLVIGAGTHEAMLSTWGYTEAFSPYTFLFVNGGLEKSLKASMDGAYTFDTYRASFLQTLHALQAFKPDRVISDNLAYILAQYPHTVLMGSFLWSDILRKKYEGNPEIEKICRYEAELLMKHKPVMLGVEDMVMPYVKMHTRFTGLPWFCSPPATESSHSATNTILMTGGGTQNAHERLLSIARTVRLSGKFTMALDRKLYNSLNQNEKHSFSVFDFSSKGFRSLSWIVCRPGIGILTDAVQHAVPVCVVGEDDPEMHFNGARVEALGVGMLASQISSEVPDQLERANCPAFIAKLRALKKGGAALAAAYILNS